MFYYEERTFDGRWTPVKAAERPKTKTGTGERTKPHRMVQEIPADKHDWTLSDLAMWFNATSDTL